ncbi:DUF3073 domain-containing protein [Nonomuraea sp. MG754425]|uniref:DUF3073 domain-containing protein n=1 Tax=Nonomuraea sp. MG754425 TaxID=2570319 RepID=UPI0023514C55|nr:DUF3073 domain-containing protein [Nonomuraea sp. MG754425]MCF6467283.1 DUF3073 domain-containing protein [Nonomuraea sp. MG754425]
MGRGRAKAKQTKVARQLKYANHNIDYDRLREELGVDPGSEEMHPPVPSDQEPEHGR